MTGFLHPLLAAAGGWLLLAPSPDSGPRLSMAEQLGFGALLGIGLTTLLLAILHLALDIRLGLPLLVGVEATLLLAGLLRARRGTRREAGVDAGVPLGSGRWSVADRLLLVVVAALLAVAAWRAEFYPVSAMDAHGYDGRARWIVAEGTLRLSIYEALDVGGRSNLTYPPLQPLASALVYWGGGAEGKVVDIVLFAALLLAVGGVVARRAGRTAGLVAAFLVIGAPEVWRHLSLGLTNVQAMAYLGAALLLLAGGVPGIGPSAESGGAIAAPVRARAGASMRDRPPGRPNISFRFLVRAAPGDILPALLLAFAAGTRPEAAVAAPLLALVAGRPLVALPAFLLFGGWQLVLADWLDATGASALRASWLPDPGRTLEVATLLARHLAEPGLLGWTLPLLVAAGVATFALRGRGGSHRPGQRAPAGIVDAGAIDASLLQRLLVLEATLAVALVALYQQIAPDFGGGGDSYLYHSLKRATFVLLPGAAAAVVLSPPTRRLLDPSHAPESRSR